MTKKLFRGSLFLSLMLIISITLSGCSVGDILNKVISGVKNCLGSVISCVGKVLQAGVKVVKKVVDVVRPVVSAIGTGIGKLTGKENNAFTKIDKGLGKVDGALDKVSNFGKKMQDTGKKLKDNKKDSAGNATNDKVTTTGTVANPNKDTDETNLVVNKNPTSVDNQNNNKDNKDNKDSKDNKDNKNNDTKVVCSPTGGCSPVDTSTSTSNNTTNKKTTSTKKSNTKTGNKSTTSTTTKINTALLTDQEKQDLTKKMNSGLDNVSSGLKSITTYFDEHKNWPKNDWDNNWNSPKENDIRSKIKKYENEIAEIKKDPTSEANIAKYNELKKNLSDLENEAKNLFRCPCRQGELDSAMNSVDNYLDKLDKTVASYDKPSSTDTAAK